MSNRAMAIVIGGGCDTDLAIIRSLGRRGIPIILISPNKYSICSKSKYVFKSITLNHPESWDTVLVPLLIENVKYWSGALLIPASDYSVEILAKNKAKISNFYIVAVPDESVINKCINKKETIMMAMRAGIPIPTTFFPKNITDIENNRNYLSYPCILKPFISHKFCEILKAGKMFKINNYEDLKSKFVTSSNHGLEMMVTQQIHGDCTLLYTYYAYRTSDGEFLGEFILKKLIQKPPDFGTIVAGESVYSQEISNLGRKFLNELSYEGLAAIEFKLDPCDNKFKLIEINARAGLGINLAIQSGVDFPWIIYNEKCRSKKIQIGSYVPGIKIIFIEKYILAYLIYHSSQNWTLKDYLKLLKGKKIYNNLDRDDISPFLFGICFSIAAMFMKFFKRK